jgi:hypothetical protein
MASITITVQSILNSATFTEYTIDDTSTVGALKTQIGLATTVDAAWYNLFYNNTALNVANTLASYGITTGSQLHTANIIARLATKKARQDAKLALAQLRRSADGDTTANYYRPNNVLTISQLPHPYDTADDGLPLVTGRPWA